MPIIPSSYSPPFLFKNGHFSTIYPNLLRKVKGVQQKRERVELADGDFIDIDWSYASSATQKVSIIIHGLEGNAQRQYMVGLAKHLNQNQWDTALVNLRNCSGEVNRLYRSYNAGVTEDLSEIIDHILKTKNYTSISLCGFSLGGNLVLKYLGENDNLPSQIKAAVAVSAPCDLYNSLLEINKPKNIIYQQRFIKHLKAKLIDRQAVFQDHISKEEIKACTSLIDIDNLYTSRAHGYKDALDYYAKCSSKQFLPNINIPTLLINAKNDSFLGSECYPLQEARENESFFLKVPDYGGHVGFYSPGNTYYNEVITLEFFEKMS